MIEIRSIIELLVIMVGIKMILENWKPPVPTSYQALLMLVLGGAGGYFFNMSKEGFVTGLIGGTIAFWGRKIFAEIKELEEGSKEDANE
ncbi:MAG: hypothetical protein RSC26_16325 [Terrisporobacter sp.]